EATTDNLPVVEEFVEEQLTSMGCSIKTITQIGVAVEEIFVNIAHYAYAPETGMAKISMDLDEAAREVKIIFEDRGIPYNPLEKEDPDTTLSAEARQIGGLGIYMTKTLMDEVLYDYIEGKNKLTLIKEF
ncbi:MAG: ATP-binding protein, partial [Firmicutes bacterium]|nr:ATP-binding protein [Bacillota bacterium]